MLIAAESSNTVQKINAIARSSTIAMCVQVVVQSRLFLSQFCYVFFSDIELLFSDLKKLFKPS